MKSKLIIAVVFFILSIFVIASVFIWKDYHILMKVQMPMIILFGYLWTTFGVAYIFDTIREKSIVKGIQNEQPYAVLFRFSTLINVFTFLFFGILAIATILILIVFDL
ncbi:hypothetical protein LF887_05050 [Chryseobacterium sp. MEBOG06]|uniref:hypothetical protein n=1 Tax=unclassified Chryseobacterium TaxID=2593645 RepID=UPI001F307C7A|nr:MULTISPECIES: hypothetical protein [unclassified Chryseobacterium]UKB85002.1 hypothetical protein LF887_05050 [Chryseobacterium sp. MEBOG06]